MDLSIKGRRAIVCGASRGLGRACAESLAREGVHVVMAARRPEVLEQAAAEPLKGKTGIPVGCFISPFCKKSEVKDTFKKLISGLKTEWVFLSYNSESLISKDDMVALLKEYGDVTVIEREYKRFKSFEYNEDKKIMEYLFCLKKVKARRILKIKKTVEIKN